MVPLIRASILTALKLGSQLWVSSSMLEIPAHSYRKQESISHTGYHSKQSSLPAALKHMLEHQQLVCSTRRDSKWNTTNFPEHYSQWVPKCCSLSLPTVQPQGDESTSRECSGFGIRHCLGLVSFSFWNISGGRKATIFSPPPQHLSFTASTNGRNTRREWGDLKEPEPHKLCGKGCLAFSLTDGMPSLFYSIYSKICLFWYPL